MKNKNLILILTLLFILGCRKETKTSDSPESSANSEFNIANVRSYLYKQLNTNSSRIKVPSTDSAHTPVDAFIFWKKAREFKKSIFDIVEVPILFNEKRIPLFNFYRDNVKTKPDYSVFEASFTRLIIYKNSSNGVVDKKIITYIPDKDYLTAHNFDASNNWLDNLHDFTGYLEYLNWNGTIQFVIRMANGKQVTKYVVTVLSNMKPNQVKLDGMNVKPSDVYCFPETNEDYVEGCYINEDGIQECSGVRDNGTSTTEWVCIDLGATSTPTPTPSPDPSADPNYGGGGGVSAGSSTNGNYAAVADANYAKLCGGVATIHVGDSYAGTVTDLGFTVQARIDGEQLSFPVSLGTVCFDIPDYLGVTAPFASEAFITAYNLALAQIIFAIHEGSVSPNAAAVRPAMIILLVANLNGYRAGSTLSSDACQGGVPSTSAPYCR